MTRSRINTAVCIAAVLAVSIVIGLWCVDSAQGAIPLRQSTAVTLVIGPFILEADGQQVTDLAMDYDMIEVSKNGAAFAANTRNVDPCHMGEGRYNVYLGATETSALGVLYLNIIDANCTGAAPSTIYTGPYEFEVIGPNHYIAKYRDDEPNLWLVRGTVPPTSTYSDLSKTIRIALEASLEEGDANSLSIAQYLEDINNVYTDWKNGGRLDLIVDDILLDTGTTIPGTITTMQGNVTDILTDTGTTIPGTITTLQATADAIETDTGEIGAAGVGLTAITGLAIAEEDIATLSEVGAKVVLDMDADSVLPDILLDTAEIGEAGAGLTDITTADLTAILEAVTTLLLRLR